MKNGKRSRGAKEAVRGERRPSSKSSVRYQTSRFLVALPLSAGWSFCCHAVLGRRRFRDQLTVRWISAFQKPRTVEEAAKDLRSDRDLWAGLAAPPLAELTAQGQRIVAELVEEGLLVEEGAAGSELERLASQLQSRFERDRLGWEGLGEIEDRFAPWPESAVARTGETEASQEGLERREVVLLGWCAAQAAATELAKQALQRGWLLRIRTGFPQDYDLLEESAVDLVILQLASHVLLSPVLDDYETLSENEVQTRVRAACGQIERTVEDVVARIGTAVLLVQGIAAPQSTPWGLLEGHREQGFLQAIRALDEAVRRVSARHSRTIFIDEEQLFGRVGKQLVLDDALAVYGHHAPPDERGQSLSAQVLAQAWLDAWEASLGDKAVRCVVTDLDGTLWPGELADPAFSFSDREVARELVHGQYGGLHQALRILRARGLLLAAVSRNTPGLVQERWHRDSVALPAGVERERLGRLLTPEDFVMLKIGWRPKSELLREIAEELQLPQEALAFVEDNPVDRAEVRHALPGVWVLGDDLGRVRWTLLNHPRFQPLERSREAADRTTTTRARLQREREAGAAPDHSSFLQSLQVRCLVRRERDGTRAQRIQELLRRTTQFNTTGLKLTVEEIEAMIQRDTACVLTLEVSDRFGAQGLVGVALLNGPIAECIAISCRAMGVEIEDVLLRAVLEACLEREGAVVFRYRATDRNGPAKRLFRHRGMRAIADGYEWDRAAAIPRIPGHCQVQVSS